jgi:hypothetical protein
MHDFAAAGGMTDMHGALEVKVRRQRREVVGIVIHVVAVPDLARAAVAAPVMRDDAEAMVHEEQHLRVPIVGRKRPAVAEHDRLPAAPILVEDLDAVLGGDRRHGNDPVRCFYSECRVLWNDTTCRRWCGLNETDIVRGEPTATDDDAQTEIAILNGFSEDYRKRLGVT